ncbi:hypothetical protein H1S01_09800 [Heliobacterium chlorum]|uniref:Uncharacterized protein n=1 Tax=Heliobacterium chlorum TaxID=2698 RepID=A0ABR7T1Z8_HELCL|nr:hypothetical protein [Heliobacterium chlorum]MBC9784804.1 hypothetical protein [Heliobacterium chlorum]
MKDEKKPLTSDEDRREFMESAAQLPKAHIDMMVRSNMGVLPTPLYPAVPDGRRERDRD